MIIRGFSIGLDVEFVETVLSPWEKLTYEQAMGRQAIGLNAKTTLIRQGIFMMTPEI